MAEKKKPGKKRNVKKKRPGGKVVDPVRAAKRGSRAPGPERVGTAPPTVLAESPIKKHEEMSRSLFNFATDCIFLLDPLSKNGAVILDANIAACTMHGYSREELIGKPIALLDDPESVRKNPERVARLRAGENLGFEINHVRKDGSVFPVEVSATQINIGNRPYILSIDRDITKRRRAEEESAQRGAKLQQIMDTASVAIGIVDKTGRVSHANMRMGEMFGRSMNELIGCEYIELVHPEEREIGRQNMLALLASKIPAVDLERHYVRKDGTEFWGHLACRRFLDAHGNELGLVGVITDITERKRAEEELKKANQRISNIIESISDGFLAIDREWRVSYINRHAAENGNFKPEELINQNIWEKMPFLLGTRLETNCRTVMTTGVPAHFEFHSIDQGKWYQTSVYPSAEGISVHWIDITVRKTAEEALKTAHAELARRAYELKAVNRELEAFSYTVSHDLKKPLRSIDGFTKALLEDYPDKLDATGKDYLSRVNTATLRMNQLIDAMLKMAKLTRGEMHENVVNLSSLAQVIAHKLKKRDPGRQVEFVLADKLKVKGDSTMMEVMLQNLIENAWKFTSRQEAAKIEFGAVDMEGNTVYYVRDNGAGFNMQYSDKLFMPFMRLHANSEFPGIGIGLAIAHRIIVRHGGRMWAEGAVGKGATVYFTLQPA